MHSVDHITNSFDRNRKVIHRQAEGLTHADSLRQAPFRANCFNWVLGHVLVHRDKAIRELGGRPVLDAATAERYGYESHPITEDGPDVVSFERLLDLLDDSQEELQRSLGGTGDDGLTAEIEISERKVPLWKRVDFLLFHDTYHTGQTELLRQLAGVDDKVI